MTATHVEEAASVLVPLPLDPAAELPLTLEDPRLDTPAMLVDLDIAEANIASMAAFARRSGLRLRPHLKTHKSLAMARRQLAAGAAGLCAATVGEAAVFAAGGVTDLTLAYPVVGARRARRELGVDGLLRWRTRPGARPAADQSSMVCSRSAWLMWASIAARAAAGSPATIASEIFWCCRALSSVSAGPSRTAVQLDAT